jgi:hypothetical protein
VTAPARRSGAADLNLIRYRDRVVEHWQRAVEIRREWLAHGLSTQPADRAAGEHALAHIYARISRRRPRFVWVDSPRQALPLLTGLPTHDALHAWVVGRQPPGPPPVASDLAARLHRLRSRRVPDRSRPRPTTLTTGQTTARAEAGTNRKRGRTYSQKTHCTKVYR